jgi:anthranilate phosphoribosyltransferase
MLPQPAIQHLLEGGQFTYEQARSVMQHVMSGDASAVQIGALLVLLRQRRESVAEIAGFASVMRDNAEAVETPAGIVLDTCGTGGDATGTFNLSTLAALVVAAAGVCVAKHGNRSVSSRVGSADLLEGLGVRLELTSAQVTACMRATGFGFLFAPLHHRAMKHAVLPRRELGVRTVFNVLGPLTNPAGATHQVLGVYDAQLTGILAEVLGMLGVERALVVHGMDGVDEVSCTGPTQVAELQHGVVRERLVAVDEFVVPPCSLTDLQGGDLQDNLAITERVLLGEPGPHLDAVAINAAAAFYVAGQVDDLAAGTTIARELLTSGRVRDQLDRVITFTQEVAR